MERILVVFQAATSKAERLALAFGLGAVEGGANIRLRHLAGAVPATLEHQGYGRLTDADIEWAEILGLAIEAIKPIDELQALIQQIDAYQQEAKLPGKSAYIFGHAARTPSIDFAEKGVLKAGFSLVREEIAQISKDLQYVKTAGQKLAALTRFS